MKRILFSLILALSLALPAAAQVVEDPSTGASISSGSTISGCNAITAILNVVTGALTCNPASVVNGTVTTAGRSILTIQDTISGSSATSNFFNNTGTFPATLTVENTGALFSYTLDNDAQIQNGLKVALTGTPGTGVTNAIRGSASTGGGTYAIGLSGVATGGNRSVGVAGFASAGPFPMGGYFGFTDGTINGLTAALVADNHAVAAPIFIGADNGTAVFTIADGGNITLGTNVSITNANWGGFRPSATPTLTSDNGNQLTLGNGTTTVASVPAPTLALTASTMTASITAQYRTVTHAYAWTNAMVTALGASLTGDINVATLPAKTRVESALLVIDTAAGGVTTLTVSCGDAIGGTPFTNYIVASDAKAAANTVYGDLISGAETGTSLFDATTKWRQNYIPSYTATTLVTCHFISTGTNLNTVTTSTGRLILTTTLLP